MGPVLRSRVAGLRAWPGWALLIATAATSFSTVESESLSKSAATDGRFLTSAIRTSARVLPADARQLVLVTTPDWNSTRATLQTFTRAADGWHSATAPVPVVIGRAGAAWGIGLNPPQDGTQKHEGDGRSPAGMFSIGTAFGYAAAEKTQWPYAALGADDYCIDVDGSPLYNRIVDAGKVGTAAVAGSTEPMRRDLHSGGDQAYKLGFVIEHNPRGTAGAGSCIFAHLWKSPDSTTAGCTAMAEPVMQALVAWLRPQDHPVFVLLPRKEYARLKSAWDLPDPVNAK
jgi:L,D-peptidoglycan transpeptidase YkuD (ErfK/YbiS/YcfS/YnhG family)